MLFLLKAHLEKPQNMSNKEFYGVWLKEAEAAVAAHKAGLIKAIWKVPGKTEVLVVLEVDSPDALEAVILNLPIWKLGYSHIVTEMEWTPLRAYEHWYEDLKKLAAE